MTADGDVLISFGSADRERLEFVFEATNFARKRTESDDWLDVHVCVRATTFHGTARASITVGDVTRLLPELRVLYDSLRGTATFASIERQVGFTITGDGMGHMKLQGFLRDQAGGENRLEFTLIFDQTLLWHSIAEIEEFPSLTPNDT